MTALSAPGTTQRSTLWRISNHADLTGQGGLRRAARWHSAGHRIVYLAHSPAGAMIEILVHLELRETDVPPGYQLLEVAFPEKLSMESIQPETRRHHAEWKLDHAYTRSLGDEWLRSAHTAVAQVPSAILPNTWNYLLNPDHPHASQVTIRKMTSAVYDPRLLPKLRG